MNVTFDYYQILEIGYSASQKEIKQAYYRLARKYHPDVNKEPNAEEMLKRINEAYEVLSDPDKRQAYDRFNSENDFSSSYQKAKAHQDGSYQEPSVNFDDFVDFNAERQETGIDWRELVESSDSLYDKLKTLFEQIIVLPSSDIQTSILMAFMMTPSAMSNNLPIGVLYGSSGSGKSETSKLVSALHNTPMMTAASTFASLRNVISNSRFYDSDKMFEKNFLLVWDDINERVFLDSEQMFSLFKSGINRKSLITIADKNGVNIEFHPFSPKCVSTVSPFWEHPKLTELKRRILPFLFKKLADSNHVIIDLVSCDDINFNGLSNEFESFWRFKPNREEFNSAKRSLARTKSSVIPLEIQRLFTDVIATLATITELNPKDALKQFEMYYEFINVNILDSNIGITRIFEEWIEQEEAHFIELMELRGSEPPFTVLVKPLKAFQFFDDCYSNGEISNKVDRTIIESLFVNRGYAKVKTKIGYQWSKQLCGS